MEDIQTESNLHTFDGVKREIGRVLLSMMQNPRVVDAKGDDYLSPEDQHKWQLHSTLPGLIELASRKRREEK